MDPIRTIPAVAAVALALATGPAHAQQPAPQDRSGYQQPTGRQPPQMGQQPQQMGQQPTRADIGSRMLADRVFVNLAKSPTLGTADIRVSARQGVVTLSGVVPTQEAEQRAIRIATRTPGVRDVVDQLEVGRTARMQSGAVDVSDGELTRRIAQKLATETFPGATAEEGFVWGWNVEEPADNWEIEVEVDDRDVTLEGSVDSFGDIRRAVQAAREVPGVRSVESELSAEGLPYYGYGAYPYHAYDPYDDPYFWY